MNDVPSGPDLVALGERVEKAAVKAYREEISRQYPDTPGASLQVKDDHFKDIPTAFKVFEEPSYIYPQVMADHVKAGLDTEGLGAGEMTNVDALKSKVGGEGSQWHGDAAENFSRFYLQPFMNCVNNQKEAMASLEAATRTYADVLKRRNKDAKVVGDKAIEALESLGGCSSAEGTLGLTLLGTAITVIGTVATGGSLGFVLAAGAATSLASLVSNAKGLSTSTVNGIVASMYTALEDIDKDVDHRAGLLAGKLSTNNGLVDDHLAKDKNSDNIPVLVPREPNEEGVPRVTDGGDLGDEFVPPGGE